MDNDRIALRKGLGRPVVAPYAVWFVFSALLVHKGFAFLMVLQYAVNIATLRHLAMEVGAAAPEARRFAYGATAAAGIALGGELGFLFGATRGLVLWSLLWFAVVRALTALTMTRVAAAARVRPALYGWRRVHVVGAAVGVIGLLLVVATHVPAAGSVDATRRIHGVTLAGAGGVFSLLVIVLVLADVVVVAMAMRGADRVVPSRQLLDEVSGAAHADVDDVE